ncbi:MAG: response regulator [Proteobacteria bacterium]|nr:response regulator [Pseudomonadota bacterium]
MNQVAPTTASEQDAIHGTVLCIEDHPVTMAVVEGMLATFPGIKLLKAGGGREGVHIARTQLPELILLDMRLPDISGLEVVRALSDEISQQKLAVVLLTADNFSIDVVKAMSLGARDYWIKPLTLAKLQGTLGRLLERVRADRARRAQR